MSRVGKKPIPIPEKVDVTYQNRLVKVNGAKGSLTMTVHPSIDLKIEDGIIHVEMLKADRNSGAFQGLVRSLVANMIHGVDQGFRRVLEINGIGYRAEMKGKTIVFHLGYSHPINFELPEGIDAAVDRNSIVTLTGINKDLLGQTAAAIRQLRPPEPYKGKGIKYAEEMIRKKAGKTGTK